MKKIFYDIITIILLILVIIQAPIFYYYTFGLFSFFVVTPYLIFGICLTIWLLTAVIKNNKSQMTNFHKIGVILVIIIGTLSLSFGENLIENLDWKFRRSSREEIVQLVKINKLKPNVTHNNIICKLHNWNYPPISNGGNEIAIYRADSSNITIEFFINRGFLDHYSAFVYTNDVNKIEEIEEHIKHKKGLHVNEKLDKNWYRVSY